MAALLLALLLLLALCTGGTEASTFPPHAKDGRLWQLLQAEDQQLFRAPAQQLWFSQQLDHFSSDANATFKQRYYEVDEFWKAPSGPVILYIGGEGALEQAPLGSCTSSPRSSEPRCGVPLDLEDKSIFVSFLINYSLFFYCRLWLWSTASTARACPMETCRRPTTAT